MSTSNLLKLISKHFFHCSGTIRSASATPSNSPQSSQQSVYQPAQQGSVSVSQAPASAASLTSPPDQPTWNPFGDDNFSKLTAEDLLNKDFTKLADGNFACTHTFQNAVINVLKATSTLIQIHPKTLSVHTSVSSVSKSFLYTLKFQKMLKSYYCVCLKHKKNSLR